MSGVLSSVGIPSWRWTSVVGAGLEMRVAARARLLDDEGYWRQHTARIQVRQLRNLLRKARATDFGERHRFGRIAKLDDADLLDAYRAEVAPADWYAFRDPIRQMRELGEPDVLWPGVVKSFAQTSGTTAGDKFIPVSKAMLRSNYLASIDIFAQLVQRGMSIPAITTGKCLFLGGSTALEFNEHGIATGDLSGLVTPLIKWPLSEVYLPGAEIALESHWPTKIERMARRCVDEDVRFVSGMPSWFIVLAERVLELARERDPSVKSLRDVWPNLGVFVHGGVKYTPFDTRVRQVFSGSPDGADIPQRLELYPASEGFVAIQDRPNEPGMRLNADHMNFFEFIPLEEVGDTNARAFAAHEVEKGQRYVVVLSTCAGLWRYVLGDVVEFDSIPAGLDGTGGDGPARLRIVGRHRHFINAFGENLIVEHVEEAVTAASRATGLVVGEFTAAPVYPSPSTRAGLQLAIETDPSAPPTGLVERFREAFDQSLKQQNVDYTTKRTDGVGMGEPTITTLPIGTFHRWLESKGKLGGQHKCPRCANGREIIDDIVGKGSPSIAHD